MLLDVASNLSLVKLFRFYLLWLSKVCHRQAAKHTTALVKNVDGDVIGSTEYYFNKPLPFYLSVYAWLAYLILAGLMVYLYSRWHAAKMLRKRIREFEKEKMEQDFKMLEQEHIITQQREQLLEAELQVKRILI